MKLPFNLFPFLFYIVLIIGCQNENLSSEDVSYHDNAPTQRPLTEEELKAQLYETECNEPSKYIEGSLNYQPIYKHLLSMKVKGMKLNFDIRNKATLATFKDVNVRISFLSKTGANVLEKNITIYEFLGPGKSISNKQEITCTNQEYAEISNVKWTVINATCN